MIRAGKVKHTTMLAHSLALTDEQGFSACCRRNILGRFGTPICKHLEPLSPQSYLGGSTPVRLLYHHQPLPGDGISGTNLETEFPDALERSGDCILKTGDFSQDGTTTSLVVKDVCRQVFSVGQQSSDRLEQLLTSGGSHFGRMWRLQACWGTSNDMHLAVLRRWRIPDRSTRHRVSCTDGRSCLMIASFRTHNSKIRRKKVKRFSGDIRDVEAPGGLAKTLPKPPIVVSFGSSQSLLSTKGIEEDPTGSASRETGNK